MYNLKIIIASTSPGIKGISVANWFTKIAKKDFAFNVEVLSLSTTYLSFIDEPKRPRIKQYTKGHTKGLIKTIDYR